MGDAALWWAMLRSGGRCFAIDGWSCWDLRAMLSDDDRRCM